MDIDCDFKKEHSHYSIVVRMIEVLSIAAFLPLLVILVWRFGSDLNNRFGLLIFSLLLSYILCDFLSGLAHWFADRWGTPDWPIIGGSVIRNFREHHINPNALLSHDFIETNGFSFLLALPLLGSSFLLNPKDDISFIVAGIILGISFFGSITNQIHKWSHAINCPSSIRYLQSKKIILSPQHHQLHHQGQFDQNYCITNGWLNHFLNRLGFFKKLECIISTRTRAIPHADTTCCLTNKVKKNLHQIKEFN
jgi:hypothetical protein